MIKDALNTAESKMKKTISVLTSDLTTLKAGRANPKMLDRIQVEAYVDYVQLNKLETYLLQNQEC